MTSVGIYIRVSKREQAEEGYSIPAQKRKLEAFCEVQGWENFKFYIDDGISAKDMDRPMLKALLLDVKEGLIDTLLVYRLDRLTRSVVDLYKILEDLEKGGASFRSATEPYDTASAMGRMFIGLIALLAQWERENLSERIKFGKREKVMSGKAVSWKAPFGFVIKDDTYVLHPKESNQLLQMIEMYENGRSANEIAILTRTKPDWHPMTTTDALSVMTNPALIGKGIHLGEIYGLENSEILISEERYQHILKLREERQLKRVRKSNEPHPFRMKVKCPVCRDSHLSPNTLSAKRLGTNRSTPYKCGTCKKNGIAVSITELKIESALIAYMRDIPFERKTVSPSADMEKDREQTRKEFNALSAKREKLTMSWSEGLINDEEYKKFMASSRLRFDELSEQLEKQPETEQVIDTAPIKKMFMEMWPVMTKQEKYEFCQRYIKTIHVHRGDRIVENGKSGYKITVTDVDFYAL